MEIVNISYLFYVRKSLDPSIYDGYDSKRFSGAILSKGKIRILIFRSKKIVITGVIDSAQATKTVEEIVGPDEITGYRITNIVAKGKIPFELDFNTMLMSKKFSWEPEFFPGIHWRSVNDSKQVAIIFRSNKIIITGVKKFGDIDKLYKELLNDVSIYRR